MENSAQQSGMDSVRGASVLSSVLFVTVAAMVAATALQCSGFVALVGWFTVSGASSCWL
jgi:hypothetical protein